MSPEDGDEAAAIGRITDGLLQRLPGIQTIVMDGIYSHVHIDPYVKKGLLVANKTTRGKNGRNSVKIGDHWEKSHHIETVEVPYSGGVCRAWGWHNQSLRMLLHAGQVNAEASAIHLARLADHDRLDPVDDDPQVA